MQVPTYELPDAAIAQHPIEPRDAARLLDATTLGAPVHRHVRDLPDLVGPGDVMVVNTSRVVPARLTLRKETGGAAEVLLLEPDPTGGPDAWTALVRPGRRLPPGTTLLAGERPVVTVGEARPGGTRQVRLHDGSVLGDVGQIPLPPYIHEPLADAERYQTVYADRPGSVAAPTAGLHLTEAVLDACRDQGAVVASVDLAVGLGTFRPVKVADAADHEMHAEAYAVPPATLEACAAASRVIAIGTTTVRALETAAASGQASGRSQLFIHEGHPWRAVDVLLTNFHQPRSTLLLLLEAFCGPDWRDLYATALGSGYRFLSFGDAMVVTGGRRRPIGTVAQ